MLLRRCTAAELTAAASCQLDGQPGMHKSVDPKYSCNQSFLKQVSRMGAKHIQVISLEKACTVAGHESNPQLTYQALKLSEVVSEFATVFLEQALFSTALLACAHIYAARQCCRRNSSRPRQEL